MAERAGAPLTPAEAWLLGQVDDGVVGSAALSAREPRDREALTAALGRLCERGLVAGGGSSDGGAGPPASLTPEGQALRGRLLDARQQSLSDLVADWEPEGSEVDSMVERLSRELGAREPRLRPA